MFGNWRLLSVRKQFGFAVRLKMNSTLLLRSSLIFKRNPLCFRYMSSQLDFEKMVKSNKVVVFMKGIPEAPRCGFSNAVVQILRMHGVNYDSHDVLKSEDIRDGIKKFSNWPTIPQVFINGEFVGGCDILLQMHQNGDLIDELKKVGITSALLDKAVEENKKTETQTKAE